MGDTDRQIQVEADRERSNPPSDSLLEGREDLVALFDTPSLNHIKHVVECFERRVVDSL